jgi:Rieske 2Fe-2S family protein
MATEAKSPTQFRKSVATFRPGAETLPQRYFVSEEIFAEELQKVFATNWVLVGHQSQLAAPGDYFLAEVDGESLIVTKDQRSTIRAFYNVCRHRGARLCEEQSGHAATIQCPYHAWTYALDGRLLGAPHMDETPGFNKTEYPLKPARLGLWEGFIFLNLSDASVSLEKWFEPLGKKFSAWNLATLRSAKRIDYEVQANWKLMRIASNKSLTMSGNACALPVGNFGDEDFRFVFYYSIFPNMLLSLHPDYVMVHRLEPQSPKRTLIFCDWFFNPEAFKRSDFDPEDAVGFWDMVNRQDWHVCELSQRGISSRAYEPGPYSARESIPAAWDREYLRHLH